MDIELAVDVLELSASLDHIVIFSGDGDFRRLVEAVQARGVRVSIVSTLKSQPPMAADELRRQADNFIELTDLKDEITRVGGQQTHVQPPKQVVTKDIDKVDGEDDDNSAISDPQAYLETA
jgi:uncharacterized LabA/DUF88 family protein